MKHQLWHRSCLTPIIYSCSIIFTAVLGASSSSSIPSTSSAKRHENPRDHGIITTATGRNVSIPCAPGPDTLSLVRWTKDANIRLPANHRQKIDGNGTLVIINAQKSDRGNYTCHHHSPGTTSASSAAADIIKGPNSDRIQRPVMLRVIESPRIIPFDFPSDVMVGMKVKVMCSISQGDAPLTFEWLKDGIRIDQQKHALQSGVRVESNGDYSILSIEGVQTSQGGNFSCRVTNPVAAPQIWSSKLLVNEPPRWIQEPMDSNIISGQGVTIVCSADGNPNPSITWKKASDPWDMTPLYNDSHFSLMPDGSLQIRDANRALDGVYFCSASNGFGSDIGKAVRLTVNEPPRFEARMKSKSVRKSDNIQLECLVTSGDLPISIQWTKDQKDEDKVVSENKERILIEKQEKSSHLMIRDVERADGGVYRCSASNKYGQDFSLIQVTVKEIPEAPRHLQIVNVSESSVSISWIEPVSDGNSPISQYLITISDPITNETLIEKFYRDRQNVSIHDLKANRAYRIEASAQNEVGWSPSGEFLFFRTEESTPAGPPLSVSATPTGPNSVKIGWRAPEEDLWNGQITGFYVGYYPVGSSQELQKIIETSKKRSQHHSKDSTDRYEVHLTNLQRSTRYSAYVRAINSKGRGPPSDEVTVKTLDDVPPTAPNLRIHSSTSSSITLGWHFLNSLGASGVYQFILCFRKTTGSSEWNEVPISTKDMLYAVNGLECGQTYEFFMTAHNSVGKSEPSSPITGKTQGSTPIPSPSSEFFLRILPTEIAVNVSSWRSGGCSILHFDIRFRPKHQREWIDVKPNRDPMLSARTGDSDGLFYIRNLTPNTLYDLEVVARNSGGSSQMIYEFSTKSSEGVFKIKPSQTTDHNMILQKYDSNLSTNQGLMTPIIVSSIILLLVVLIACVLCSKGESSLYSNRRRESSRGFLDSKNGGNKVPFQNVSLKDLTEAPRLHSVPLEIDMNEMNSRTTYARPYDVFPMSTQLDSTIRRVQEKNLQERAIYGSMVPSSQM